MLLDDLDVLKLLKKIQESTTEDVDEENGSFNAGDKVIYNMYGAGLTNPDLTKMLGANEHASRANHHKKEAIIIEAEGDKISRYNIKFDDGFAIHGVSVSELKLGKPTPEEYALPASHPKVIGNQDRFPIQDVQHARAAIATGCRLGKEAIEAKDPTPPSWWDSKLSELLDELARAVLKNYKDVDLASLEKMEKDVTELEKSTIESKTNTDKVNEKIWWEELLKDLREDTKFASLVKEHGSDSDKVQDYFASTYWGHGGSVETIKKAVEDAVKELKLGESKTNETKFRIDYMDENGFDRTTTVEVDDAEEAYRYARERLHAASIDSVDKVKESKTNEAEETLQTMKPQEKPDLNAEDYHMEDYSEEDFNKPDAKIKSKSPEKGDAIRKVEDNELEIEPDKVVKPKKESKSIFRKQKPLWLCNECFKTFRSFEGICKDCKSKNVEKITEGESGLIGFYKQVYKVDYKDSGGEDSIRVEAFDVLDAKKMVRKMKPGVNILGVKKISEGKNQPGKQDGTGPAKRSYQRKTKGSVGKKKEAGEKCPFESKLTEAGIDELIGEVPGIDVDDQKILHWALKQGIISDTWPDEDLMVEALTLVDEQIPEEEKDEMEPRALYLKYLMLPRAKREYKKMKLETRPNENTSEDISPEGMKALQAPKLRFNYGTVEDHAKVMKDLAKTDTFSKTMVGTQVVLVDSEGFPATYAKDKDLTWKPWTAFGFVEESRIEEREKGKEEVDVESIRGNPLVRLAYSTLGFDIDKASDEELKKVLEPVWAQVRNSVWDVLRKEGYTEDLKTKAGGGEVLAPWRKKAGEGEVLAPWRKKAGEMEEQDARKRWVYGARTNKWYLVGPEDRDYKYGLSQVDFETMDPEEAKKVYLGPQQVESKTNGQDTDEDKIPSGLAGEQQYRKTGGSAKDAVEDLAKYVDVGDTLILKDAKGNTKSEIKVSESQTSELVREGIKDIIGVYVEQVNSDRWDVVLQDQYGIHDSVKQYEEGDAAEKRAKAVARILEVPYHGIRSSKAKSSEAHIRKFAKVAEGLGKPKKYYWTGFTKDGELIGGYEDILEDCEKHGGGMAQIWVGETPEDLLVREESLQKKVGEAEETFRTVAKGIEDKLTADEIAGRERGMVVADEESPEKFMVIVKEE